MKNLLIFALMAMFVIACNSNGTNDAENNDEQSSGIKKYDIESGYITYKMSMMGMDTKTTMYFKDYGKTEASITEMEMMGQKSTTKMLRKDNIVYSYSLEQKMGTKMKMGAEDIAAEGEMGRLDEKTIVDQMGGTKMGTEKILGKECVVYEVTIDDAKSKYWIWENMVFKMVASQNQMEVTMEAVDFKETSDFPAGTFDVPTDIKFTDPNEVTDFDKEDAAG
ncbi:MAG: hypothetical protein P1P88_01315 [Bacteroidales bacterium]|nr:hypothetical protein [Bacteroidales bacterium]